MMELWFILCMGPPTIQQNGRFWECRLQKMYSGFRACCLCYRSCFPVRSISDHLHVLSVSTTAMVSKKHWEGAPSRLGLAPGGREVPAKKRLRCGADVLLLRL